MLKLALHGGTPVRLRPFNAWPPIEPETEKRLVQVYRSGQWGAGEEVRQFEKSFAAYVGARYGIAVSSGTTALEIALRALGVGSAAEVIVPAYTFFSTVSAVLRVNAIPIFMDIAPDTLCMDVTSLEAKITDKTQAIIAVHTFGYPMDLADLLSTAAKKGIHVIEDCAHAHGAARDGRKAGTFTDISMFSFMSTKLLPAGEGGIVMTSSRELKARANALRDCGRFSGDLPDEHSLLGSNNQLTDFQAAILNDQLDRYCDTIQKRRIIANKICRKLNGIDGLSVIQQEDPNVEHAYLGIAIKYDLEAFEGVPRDLFCLALQKEGIPIETGYTKPVYKNPIFLKRNFDRHLCPIGCPFYGKEVAFETVHCPTTETVCRNLLFLPHHLLYGDSQDVDDIITAFMKVKESVVDLLFETDFKNFQTA